MDAEQRALARLAFSGDVEAQAAVWARRRRSGEEVQDRLRFGAYLGDPACRLVLGNLAETEHRDVVARVDGLNRWGPEAVERGRLGAAWELARRWVALTDDWVLVPLLVGADALVACRCGEHRADLQRRIEDAAPLLRTDVVITTLNPRYARPLIAGVVSTVCALIGIDPRAMKLRGGYRGASDLALDSFVVSSLRVITGDDLWSAIADDLMPWAVGEGDPPRERWAARERATHGLAPRGAQSAVSDRSDPNVDRGP